MDLIDKEIIDALIKETEEEHPLVDVVKNTVINVQTYMELNTFQILQICLKRYFPFQ